MEKKIRIDFNASEKLVIRGDEEKMKRAFSNILDNAIKYNYEGGQIEITANQDDIELRITIANTGQGVSEAEIPKVFDQFYRVDKSRSTHNGGSGLGLAIVKRIVELHGGEVIFKSLQGDWTKVTVTLPQKQ